MKTAEETYKKWKESNSFMGNPLKEFKGNPEILKENFISGVDFWYDDEVEKYFINEKTEREIFLNSFRSIKL